MPTVIPLELDRYVWSHPALVGNRLYVRNLLGVYCLLLVVPGLP